MYKALSKSYHSKFSSDIRIDQSNGMFVCGREVTSKTLITKKKEKKLSRKILEPDQLSVR